MNLAIGSDNFGKIIRNNYYFVDKSLFIKEVIDDAVEVLLITRPRRFGKTLNISMLHHFLAHEVDGQTTKGLFKGLKITKAGNYMEYQGKYPVIFITFKDIKENNYKSAYLSLCKLMSHVYYQHKFLLSSKDLDSYQKEVFRSVLEERATEESMKSSLLDLSYYLTLHYKVKTWILIDEYDTPIQSSHIHEYYEEMISLIRVMFSAALKTNPYLNKAVITGVLRIAKESLFSGLNNLKVYSIMNSKYGEYFGFTEDEVLELLKQEKMENKFEDIKSWYDGYYIGNVNVYNPWSIVNSIEDKRFIPYWVNTGDTTLIKSLIAKSEEGLKKEFESILSWRSVEALVDENMVIGDLYDDKKDAIWGLLLFSGYLKTSSCEYTDYGIKCILECPNKEVLYIYRKIVHEWFTEKIGQSRYEQFLSSLTEGRIEEFYDRLKDFLLESSSVFDVKGKNPEKFYHGFVLGLIVSLGETHIIKSNKESGYGRYDVMIIPKDKNKLGLILEFKVARDELSLKEEAENALNQIIERNYETEMKQIGINNILKLGLAFKGKEVAIWEEK